MNILIKDILTLLPKSELSDDPEVKSCSVYIKDGIIESTTTEPEGFKADKTISGGGKLLMPGLINAHTHTSMSLLRNCADDLLFNEWLFGKIIPLEDKLTGKDCYWGALLAIMEMIKTGTTSFIDMYYFLDDITSAVDESGIRAVLSRGLIGNADDPSLGESRLREAFEALDKWKNHDRISFMLAPHAPYTCDEGFQRVVAGEAKRLGLRINTHISESLTEVENIKNTYGCSPVEILDKTGLLTDKTVGAHCVHISDNDIEILADRGVCVVTNPVSNLKLANGIAPIPKLLKAGVKVALGTDGASSNNTLNMFRELSILALIHKGAGHDPLAVTACEGVSIATKGGAAAMGRSDLGVIKPGNVADLVILNLDTPNMQPCNNLVSALAYSTNGSEVETVMVGGRVIMENREFLTIDSERVYHEVSMICERIGTR
ncbi:MAG: amidohydrolase [Oscillospiraceae bacterium]|nr:amidohydrolase [Oscillospiraceae bacterium]MCL2277980.1 amidohydrolase [Oscillospiraceae bacterium]